MASAVAKEEARRFMIDCLKCVGAPIKAATEQAELLVHADSVGHFSHGLNRLEYYLNDIKVGSCNPKATPVILKEKACTAWVDGKTALGATVGHFCMDLAINKAKQYGVGWIVAKGSCHYGMAGYWAKMANEQNLIGMSMTNTSPLMAPTRSKKAALGTNPLALSAPANNGDTFLLDMATTSVAVGKLEIQQRKGAPLPRGWAQDAHGNECTDADEAMKAKCLMPLGGSEETSGYKGYGLAALVEIFCGISAGSDYAHHIRSWSHEGHPDPCNLGQCFIAIDPECFAPGFTDRMSDCLNHWRNLEPTDPSKPVLAPGDKERKNGEETENTGVIHYLEQQIKSCELLAQKLNVASMRKC